MRAMVPAASTQIEHPDGRVELIDTSRVERSALYNEDLAPVPIARRTWTPYNSRDEKMIPSPGACHVEEVSSIPD